LIKQFPDVPKDYMQKTIAHREIHPFFKEIKNLDQLNLIRDIDELYVPGFPEMSEIEKIEENKIAEIEEKPNSSLFHDLPLDLVNIPTEYISK